MSLQLERFDGDAMTLCGDGMRMAARGAQSLEASARAIARYLYDELRGPDGARACVLVRVYKTHAFGTLPDDLQRYARRVFGTMAISPPDAAMKCLTLVATTGDEPAWNDRRASQDHQAIPLPTPHIVERAPMIAQLIRELGLDLAHVVQPRPVTDGEKMATTHGIFHVERAAGSPYVPAQAGFVDRYAIRSVLGFGGTLGASDLFAVILFTRSPVSYDAADRFRDLAAQIGEQFARYGDSAVFEQGDG